MLAVTRSESCSRRLMIETVQQAGMCGVQVGHWREWYMILHVQVGTMLRQADNLYDVNEMLGRDYDGDLFTPLELEFIRQVRSFTSTV